MRPCAPSCGTATRPLRRASRRTPGAARASSSTTPCERRRRARPPWSTTRRTSACSAEDGSLAARDDEPLEWIAQCLGHRFARPELLERALTHGSRAVESGDASESNERLEFLGDAVLDLLVSEILMDAHPTADEGVLSEARARAVNSEALAERTRSLGLERAVRLGRGELRSGGRDKPSIQANVFEAVLGAIYLDAGLEAVRALVVREFGEALRAPPEALRDPKSRLQELIQRRGTLPSYALVSESASPQEPHFEVEVRVGDRTLGRGEGRSKRAAEREAALRALEDLAE